MKKFVYLVPGMIACLLIGAAAVFAAEDSGLTLNANIVGGVKQLSSDWDPIDQQNEYGVDLDFGGAGWPISLNAGYLYAGKKGNDVQLTQNITVSGNEFNGLTQEVYGGIKKIWGNEGGLNFSLAGGASWITGSLEPTGGSKSEEAKAGWYGSAGLYYTLAKFINLGVYGRYSDAKVTIARTELNAGGMHYGALVGFHF